MTRQPRLRSFFNSIFLRVSVKTITPRCVLSGVILSMASRLVRVAYIIASDEFMVFVMAATATRHAPDFIPVRQNGSDLFMYGRFVEGDTEIKHSPLTTKRAFLRKAVQIYEGDVIRHRRLR